MQSAKCPLFTPSVFSSSILRYIEVASQMKRLCNEIYRKKSNGVRRKREPRWKGGEGERERERNDKDRGLQGDYSCIIRNKSFSFHYLIYYCISYYAHSPQNNSIYIKHLVVEQLESEYARKSGGVNIITAHYILYPFYTAINMFNRIDLQEEIRPRHRIFPSKIMRERLKLIRKITATCCCCDLLF